MQKNTKLLACPFCGSEPYIAQNYGDWYVGCNCPIEPAASDYDKERAIELWNTRKESDNG